ncbi:MAG: T9SS type A sorting domain-containing protein, partial [Ignavibacteriaceae bacterium]
NYPNPFNPVTSIQYAIANKQFVKLIVYDVLGNEIAVLVNEEKPAGEYKVTFNAAGLPSGVYLYQLKAGEFNSVRKLVLLK